MKWTIRIGLIALVLVAAVLLFAGNYFYTYAFVPAPKDFLASEETTDSKKTTPEQAWFNGKTRKRWQIKSEDNLLLSAIYLPAKTPQNKTAILAHGYMANADSLWQVANIYHDLGYDVLLPDARGHGQSQGEVIGFGWPERKDYLGWINKVLEEKGSDEKITLYGISMGAATVMNTSGEKLPENVFAIVEDCGYASIKEELTYQYKVMFDLPTFPIMQVTNLVTRVRAGFFYTDGDVRKQLAKNKTPMLFIHGTADTFVPFSMLDEVYKATDAPKERWEVAGAEHAKSYDTEPEKYREKIKNFLQKYE